MRTLFRENKELAATIRKKVVDVFTSRAIEAARQDVSGDFAVAQKSEAVVQE